MTDKQFIEAIYELAFGHDAINRNFGHAEVIEQIEAVQQRFPSLSNREVEIIAARRAKRLFWEMAQ